MSYIAVEHAKIGGLVAEAGWALPMTWRRRRP